MTSTSGQTDLLADVAGLYESLRAAATRETKRRSLRILWGVLEEMRRTKARDYSVAEIGRRLEKVGGPKTQSLRNEGGKDFRDLISAYAAAVGGSDERLPRGNRTQLDIALDALPDPGIRAVFKQVVAENRMLKHQNNELRSAFKSLSVSARTESSFSPGVQSVEVELIAPRPTVGDLLPSEIEALRRSIDPDRLAENGWNVQPNGSVFDENGMSVLPPGFATAVAKVVKGAAS